ncbi:MAG TPA: signal peptide peptidase SppA [Polyangiaceae bacterium]|nr:signal peptide peptidase SppA [Polyangiaceae bacterium]
MRLLLWLFGLPSLPIRALIWAYRRAYVRFRGYGALSLRIEGTVPDRHAAPSLLGLLSDDKAGPSLLDLLAALERASRDPRIETVFVKLGPLHTGLARAQEISAVLRRVRDAGKRVVVHFEDGGLGAYIVALGASEIAMPPSGSLNVVGVASEVVFLKGLLDKVGLKAWMRARGKFKTARETLAESQMTPENREMTTAIVGDLYEQVVEAIAAGRRLDAATVRERLDRGPFLAAEALALGLVDRVDYAEDVEEELKAKAAKWRPLRLDAYLRLSTHLVERRKPTVVALVEVTGTIKSGPSVPGRERARATGSRRFVKELRAIAEDPRVKAVVLRVDSPGGSALASDLMWRALTRVSKPIVVSMADVAASGGYYVAGVRGASILASPATITGSIGVLSGKVEASGLYELLGVKKELVAAGKRAAFFSEARGFSEEDLAKLEADLDAHYALFLSRMAEGRGKTKEEIHAVAQGRVWTGRQALANGLVDEQGGLFDALMKVKSQLGLHANAPLALVSPAPKRRFPFRFLFRGTASLLPSAALRPLELATDLAGERMLAMLPFELSFE